MEATPQQFLITLTDPPRGHQGQRKKPLVSRYVVVASSESEALATFCAECPSLIALNTTATVAPTDSLVWKAA
jgi:hypothetical protein